MLKARRLERQQVDRVTGRTLQVLRDRQPSPRQAQPIHGRPVLRCVLPGGQNRREVGFGSTPGTHSVHALGERTRGTHIRGTHSGKKLRAHTAGTHPNSDLWRRKAVKARISTPLRPTGGPGCGRTHWLAVPWPASATAGQLCVSVSLRPGASVSASLHLRVSASVCLYTSASHCLFLLEAGPLHCTNSKSDSNLQSLP